MSKSTLAILIASYVILSCNETDHPAQGEMNVSNIIVEKLKDNAGVSIEIAPHSSAELFCLFRHDESKKLTIISPLDTTIWNSAELKTKGRKTIENKSSKPITVMVKASIADKHGNYANFKHLQLDDTPLSYIISFEKISRDKPNYTTSLANADISLIVLGQKENMMRN